METSRSAAGSAVRARREKMDLTIRAAAFRAGMSDTTWMSIEAGNSVSSRSVRRAAEALGWPADAYRRIMAGEDPADFHPPPPTDPGGTVVMADELIGLAAIAGKLDPADRERWVAFGRKLASEGE